MIGMDAASLRKRTAPGCPEQPTLSGEMSDQLVLKSLGMPNDRDARLRVLDHLSVLGFLVVEENGVPVPGKLPHQLLRPLGHVGPIQGWRIENRSHRGAPFT
ncbi:hypothetical protein D3C73_1441030 [compost metagenome]